MRYSSVAYSLLALLALLALFNNVAAQGLVLAGLGVWWAGWLAGGRRGLVPLLAAPALGLLGMALVGLAVSPDWRVSLPKLAGLALDLTLAAAMGWWVADRRQAEIAPPAASRNPQSAFALALAALGAALALVAPLITDFAGKVSSLLPGDWGRRLPTLLAGLTRDSFGNPQAGIQANELGGTLALLLPFALALAVARGMGDGGWGMGARGQALDDAPTPPASGTSVFGTPPVNRPTPNPQPPTPLLWTAVGLMVAALVLLGSRSGLLGALVGAGLVVAVARPRWRIGYALGALVLVAGGVGLALLRAGDPGSVDTVSFRLELWTRTLTLIRDAPWTGAGLNAFPLVQPVFYPILAHEASGFVPHAHNLYLQTAADTGVPGLVALLAGMGGLALAARRGLRAPGATPLLLGAVGGLAAWGAHGLVDAITLGAKPVLLVGLCAGIILGSDPQPTALTRPGLWRAAGRWLLLSLVVIGLLELVDFPF